MIIVLKKDVTSIRHEVTFHAGTEYEATRDCFYYLDHPDVPNSKVRVAIFNIESITGEIQDNNDD